MKELDYVVKHHHEVLMYLKSRFPMYHLSNFFFRDVQFGIQAMLEEKKMEVRYSKAERIAEAFVRQLEKERIFLPIDRQAWVVNYPEFKKPPVKPAAHAKSAGSAAAVPRPAGQSATAGAGVPGSGTPSSALSGSGQRGGAGTGK